MTSAIGRRRDRAKPAPRVPKRALAGLCVLFAAAGCSVTRATVGVGLGVGAEVQVSGLLHAGALVWLPFEAGSYYGRDYGFITEQAMLGLFHTVSAGEIHGGSWSHTCFGLAPWLDLPGWDNGWPNWHVWAVEVGLALGLVKVCVGFDPTALPSLLEE